MMGEMLARGGTTAGPGGEAAAGTTGTGKRLHALDGHHWPVLRPVLELRSRRRSPGSVHALFRGLYDPGTGGRGYLWIRGGNRRIPVRVCVTSTASSIRMIGIE